MLSARGHEVLPFADERDALVQIKADPCIEALITSADSNTPPVSSFAGRRG
jgi:hypothetical protein